MDETDVIVTSDDARTCPRGHWRPAEDEKLRQLVEQFGPQNWNSIAERLQGRSGLYIYMYIFRFLLSYVISSQCSSD